MFKWKLKRLPQQLWQRRPCSRCPRMRHLYFKTYVLYVDAIITFRFHICSNIKLQAEYFDISSNPDEELVCISNRELHQLQADVQHLHDENLVLFSTMHQGFHGRVQPLKAPIEQLSKLNKYTLYMYFASHGVAPSKRSGLGQVLVHSERMEFLIRENLVVNTHSDDEILFPRLALRVRAYPYEQDTRFLFIATPDCKLITLKFEDELVHPDDIKLKYVQLLHALHDQEVAVERVRLFPNNKFKKDDKKIESLNKKIVNLDKLKAPCLHAMHLEPFQIFVKALHRPSISLMVMSNTTIRELKEMIHDELMKEAPIPPDSWYLRLHWSQSPHRDPDNACIAYFNIQKGDTIRLQFRLRGGGKRGSNMIKTVVKSKTADKTLPCDSILFTNVFNHSEAVTRTTSVNFQSMLKTMPLNDLQSLYEYLKHDRSKKEMKIQKVAEWCKEIKELLEVQKKVHTAIDLMTNLITDNLQEVFVDSEGEFSMAELTRAVDNRIAVVKDDAMTDI